jgi:transposase InsO family protein
MHNIQAMDNHDVAKGVSLISSAHDLCDNCVVVKQTREITPKMASRPRAAKPLQLIHLDLCREIRPTSLGGNHYFVTFTNDYSKFTWIYFMRSKSQTLKYFRIFKAAIELAHHSKIEILRSDNGGEFISGAFTKTLQEARIQRELSQPYTPHQNSVSERKNQTVLEKA